MENAWVEFGTPDQLSGTAMIIALLLYASSLYHRALLWYEFYRLQITWIMKYTILKYMTYVFTVSKF